jgi:recombination protein RecR
MDPVSKLIELFSEFPGIGPRQARRFAYFVLTRPNSFIEEFTKNIGAAKKSLRTCSSCQRFFTSSSQMKLCSTCSDESREKNLLMIVARDSDFEAVEKSGVYRGLYFVLGGSVPVLEKEPEKRVRLAELKSRLGSAKHDSAESPAPSEIILSMSATPDGEHTGDVVRNFLEKNAGGVKISVLGKGLSTGTELEYSDTETLRNALKNRG